MERLEQLHAVQYVEYIPPVKEMQHGVLYISHKYATAVHLCACGCGCQAVTPLGAGYGWKFNSEGTKVTLFPSILNTHCPNQAHYFIRANKIIWT